MSAGYIFLGSDRHLRPFWRAAAFVPLFLAFLFVLLTLAATLVGQLRLQENFELAVALSGLCALGAALLGAVLLLRQLDQRSFRTLGFWFYPGWAHELGLGLLGGFGLVSIVVGLEWLLGGVHFRGLAIPGSLGLATAAWSLVVLLPAAASEELIFRGYPFQRLVEAWGEVWALLAFAVLFGGLHLKNPSATPLSTLNTGLMGILLALTYLKTRGLWLPIGLHFAWNYVLAFVYSLPVSGLRFQTVLWRVEVTGAEWLTGGNYGPEGSILTSVVAVVAIMMLARRWCFGISPAQAQAVE